MIPLHDGNPTTPPPIATVGSIVACVVVFLWQIALSTDGWSNEQILSAKASDPAATVRLLTSPHTGKKICGISDATPLRFFKRANHGPHRFAKVEVLEGACAGKQGYVPLLSLDPRPQVD